MRGGGDEGLVAVEVDLPVAAGVGGLEAAHVGARARLCACGVPDLLARADIGKDLLDLLRRALTQDRVEAGQLVQHVGGCTPAAQLLVDRRQRNKAQLEAAVLLGQHDQVEAKVAQRLHPTFGIGVGLLAACEVGLPVLALHQCTDVVHEQLLFVIEPEIHRNLLVIPLRKRHAARRRLRGSTR